MTRPGIAEALAAYIRDLPEDQWQWYMGDGREVTDSGVDLPKVCRLATDYLCDLFGVAV